MRQAPKFNVLSWAQREGHPDKWIYVLDCGHTGWRWSDSRPTTKRIACHEGHGTREVMPNGATSTDEVKHD